MMTGDKRPPSCFQSPVRYLRKLDIAAAPLGEMVTGGRHPSLLATSKWFCSKLSKSNHNPKDPTESTKYGWADMV